MIVSCCSLFSSLNLVEMFKYFPDLNDLSIAMGKVDKSGGKKHQRLKRAQWMCISVLIFFIDKTLSALLWLCFTLVFEN